MRRTGGGGNNNNNNNNVSGTGIGIDLGGGENNNNNNNTIFGAGNGTEFVTFPDTAAYGFEYKGDGSEQVEFFKENSNYDELISGMSRDQREAFLRWTEGYWMDGAMYDGWDNMSGRDRSMVRAYDSILDRSVLSKGVVLVRRTDAQLVMGKGHKTATLDELKAMEGSVVTSRGCMSFGAASQGLTIGSSSKHVEYRVKIPGGTKGAGMWVGDRRTSGWGAKQREFMINRDTSFLVGGTTYDSRRDVFVVDIEYLGRRPHDYGKKKKK